ncbi:hypothetical protein [Salinimicrobium gaetbulicola]|uniref:Uncharacterized protein n=1 Tax=Salinimicrobium gaetbulicola TaxID=999702 RepID=A0ABW3IC11_9FLAO
MTKKDFFRIIIKLFGLYSAILILFYQIPYIIQYSQFGIDVSSALFVIVSMIIAIGLFIILIFNADKIIQWLKLDQGFDDEKIDFKNFNLQNIVNFSVILIGGFLIIDNIAVFLRQIYLAFKSTASSSGLTSMIDTFSTDQADYFTLFSSGLSITLGYLMLTNFTRISKWIIKFENSNSG